MMLLIRPSKKESNHSVHKYGLTLLPRWLYWPWRLLRKGSGVLKEAALHYELIAAPGIILVTAIATQNPSKVVEFVHRLGTIAIATMVIQFVSFLLRRKIDNLKDERARRRTIQHHRRRT